MCACVCVRVCVCVCVCVVFCCSRLYVSYTLPTSLLSVIHPVWMSSHLFRATVENDTSMYKISPEAAKDILSKVTTPVL